MNNETLQTDSRIGRTLAALVAARDRGVSSVGARELARAAGADEADGTRLVDALRTLGVEVEGDASAGFGLTHEADVALPEVLEPKIAGTIFAGGVRHFASIGSTNTAAMRAGAEAEAALAEGNSVPAEAKGGLPPRLEQGTRAEESNYPTQAKGRLEWATRGQGEVWIAEEQTAGKGRAGHVWKSEPKDGIYLSALIRPKLAPVDVIILSLAAGLAVVEAVHEVTGLWGDLRWPNDVLLNGKKFCGILTELNAEVTRVRYVVVGMGLNVNNPEFPPELEAIATSLYREAGRKFSRVELVAALLRALDREIAALHGGEGTGSQVSFASLREPGAPAFREPFDKLRAGSGAPASGVGAARERILRRFEEHSSYCCGAAVEVEEDGGYQGVTRGLDERGFLRVETAGGMRTVLSGGVRKR